MAHDPRRAEERFSQESACHSETWADAEAIFRRGAALDARWLYGPQELVGAAPGESHTEEVGATNDERTSRA